MLDANHSGGLSAGVRAIADLAGWEIVAASPALLSEAAHRRAEVELILERGAAEVAHSANASVFAIDLHPVVGRLSLVAPVVTRVEIGPSGELIMGVRFGLAHQGWPGCVFGGSLALVVDYATGAAAALVGIVGAVTELSLEYHAVARLGADLCLSTTTTNRKHDRVDVTTELRDSSSNLLVTGTGIVAAWGSPA
jgi:acyl-coenzyme A thioesterase PaaI-like protein